MAAGCAVPGPKAAPPVTRGTLPATAPTPAPTIPGSPTTPAPPPTFSGSVDVIPADVRDVMTGRSWRLGCPVGLDDLRLLTVGYWGFDGQPHAGNLVAHRDHAAAVLAAFHYLFDQRFPIERIQLVDDFGADDAASMAANNTSAFNCRAIDGHPACGASTATAGPSTSTRSRTPGCGASRSIHRPASPTSIAPCRRPA